LRDLNLDWIKVWTTMIVRDDKRFRLALTLEGGGASCAYQAGVYQALLDANLVPEIIVAESVGAITAAIIAGNPPDSAIRRLKEFWETVTESALLSPWAVWTPFIPRSFWTVASGVPGFFVPRGLSGLTSATSFYDMSPLRQTLERLVDFDRINARKIHFVISAVDEASGEIVYFDNLTTIITPAHIMASCALPPGFPSVRIEGRNYWDATLVAKTPIQYLLGEATDQPLLVFQVELKQIGAHPVNDMQQVTTRINAIQYASRGQLVRGYYRNIEKVNRMLRRALQKIPEADLSEEEVRLRHSLAEEPLIAVVNLSDRGHSTDEAHDFDRRLTYDRWERGYSNTTNVLRSLDPEQLASGAGVMVYPGEEDSS
jgi:NTE family protein